MFFGHILHYASHHGRFLFIYLRNILSYASHHDEFLLTQVRFFYSCTSGTFYLVSLVFMGFFLHWSGFLNLRALDTFCFVPPTMAYFFLRWLGFLDSCISNIFCLIPLAMTIFFLWGIYIFNLCVSGTFCFMPLIIVSFAYVGRVFPTYVTWSYFVLCLLSWQVSFMFFEMNFVHRSFLYFLRWSSYIGYFYIV